MPSCTSLHFKLPVFGLWDNQDVFVHRISPPKNTAAFENIESLDLGKFIFLGLKHLQGTWWNIYKIQVTVQFMAWSKNLWTSPNKHFELWRQVAFRAYLWHAHRIPEPKRLREFKENVYGYSALHMPPWPIWPAQVVLVSVGSAGKFPVYVLFECWWSDLMEAWVTGGKQEMNILATTSVSPHKTMFLPAQQSTSVRGKV